MEIKGFLHLFSTANFSTIEIREVSNNEMSNMSSRNVNGLLSS